MKQYTSTELIAREGFKPLAFLFISSLVLVFLNLSFLAFLTLLLCALCIFLFRNPERIAEHRGDNIVVAPIDGRVTRIYKDNKETVISIKVSALDVGTLRSPMHIARLLREYKYGLFITRNERLKEVLNTRHCISALNGEERVFTITVLPEMWNKVSIYPHGEAYLGDRLGFMKYGDLILRIHQNINLKVREGDIIYGGRTTIGSV